MYSEIYSGVHYFILNFLSELFSLLSKKAKEKYKAAPKKNISALEREALKSSKVEAHLNHFY